MIRFKIKIECFAKRYHMGTLGGKGLNKFANFPIFFNSFLCTNAMLWLRGFATISSLLLLSGPSSRSPDLNSIENLWGIMVNECTDRNERTPDVLERHYMKVWERICRDPELCQQLVQSMRHRMQDCIDNGSRTKPPLRPKPPSDKNPKSGQNHRWQKLFSRWTR